MGNKITWEMIYSDFKKRHPHLKKQVTYWCPQDYLTIQIFLEDGMKMTYNYFDHVAKILPDRWKHDS